MSASSRPSSASAVAPKRGRTETPEIVPFDAETDNAVRYFLRSTRRRIRTPSPLPDSESELSTSEDDDGISIARDVPLRPEPQTPPRRRIRCVPIRDSLTALANLKNDVFFALHEILYVLTSAPVCAHCERANIISRIYRCFITSSHGTSPKYFAERLFDLIDVFHDELDVSAAMLDAAPEDDPMRNTWNDLFDFKVALHRALMPLHSILDTQVSPLLEHEMKLVANRIRRLFACALVPDFDVDAFITRFADLVETIKGEVANLRGLLANQDDNE